MNPLRLIAVLLLVCAMFGMNQMALAHHHGADGGRPADEAAVLRFRRMNLMLSSASGVAYGGYYNTEWGKK
uniref:Uncharacterized protein n=1 Tax=Globodera rostochiensis TaxID=31243 RepID=A0A914I0T8_GLORO